MNDGVRILLVLLSSAMLPACSDGTASRQSTESPAPADDAGNTAETTARAPTDESTAVRACYNGYKQAILDQNGRAAVALVTASTIDYYGKMRDLALTADRETVRSLSATDKVTVLMVRHLLAADAVEKMTATALFVHAVDNGWIGRESVINNEIGDVTVSGAHATGVHVSAGRKTPFRWTFRKEDGGWKFDLTEIMPLASIAFKQVIQASGVPEDEFLLDVLESLSGRKVSDSVWEPMRNVEGTRDP